VDYLVQQLVVLELHLPLQLLALLLVLLLLAQRHQL
jgi:hypothetical protein